MVKNFSYIFLCLIIFNSNFALSDTGPNYKKEKNISEQILQNIFDGEINQITSSLGEKFSIIKQTSKKNKNSILLLHGRGLNPDEETVINPLRLGLFDVGYNTYSIQLPVLIRGSTYYDYIKIFKYSDERIEASIQNIADDNEEIIIIAHSCGVHMLMSWIEKYNNNSIKAFILIGSEATDLGQKIIKPYPFQKISVPILDIYGENDYKFVKSNAHQRLKKIKKSLNVKSSQIKILGSDHYHHDNVNELLKAVKQWLKTT